MDRTAQSAPSAPGVSSRIKAPVRALLGYLTLAVLFFAPLVSKLTTHILTDDVFIRTGQSDAYTGLWTYWWLQRAALMGRDLLHCTWVLPPTGADLLFHSTSIAPTLLTIPLGGLFGVVAGYNLMVILMVVGNAWVYYYFLSKTLSVSKISAFVSGALFGFCPYFLFKAHAHINLIGGLFWGGCLGVLLFSYLKERFSVTCSILFCLLLWATFWTSVVEFFMLIVALGGAIVVLELAADRPRTTSLPRRLLFFLPSVVGGIPAALLYHGAEADVVSRQMFPGFGVAGLFAFPRLSVLSGISFAKFPEYWGTYLPLVAIVLTLIGIVVLARVKPRLLAVFGSLAGFCLVLTLNPFDLASTLIRALPMGSGFRVFGRFFPVFLFFFLIPACYGYDRIAAIRKPAIKGVALLALLILAATEYVPIHLNPSPVKIFHMEAQKKDGLNRDKFVLVIPKDDYRNVHDTYQASLDLRFVNLSYLARENSTLTNLRTSQFPIIYGKRLPNSPDQFKEELRRLGVGYLLFETKSRAMDFPLQGMVVAEDSDQVLVDVSHVLE
jgi:hypothetical protein